jgi:hypothetical protein
LSGQIGDIGKKLGEEWTKLPDAQRKPYEEKAAKDKQRYEAEKAEKAAAKNK